ncbi:hypothetical protein CEXT_214701 [Caerostris extrusa]|uniref:Uncharacterized protein n=1 Tax=Caerostris extrusa TaxID=172846 RepID=A0AAV4PIP6_CAEEX|nr:hypothetical protein CEXT_214701 [Caerostris extrusa]
MDNCGKKSRLENSSRVMECSETRHLGGKQILPEVITGSRGKKNERIKIIMSQKSRAGGSEVEKILSPPSQVSGGDIRFIFAFSQLKY